MEDPAAEPTWTIKLLDQPVVLNKNMFVTLVPLFPSPEALLNYLRLKSPSQTLTTLSAQQASFLNALIYFILSATLRITKLLPKQYDNFVRKSIADFYVASLMKFRLYKYSQLCYQLLASNGIGLPECIHSLYYLFYGRLASQAYVNMLANSNSSNNNSSSNTKKSKAVPLADDLTPKASSSKKNTASPAITSKFLNRSANQSFRMSVHDEETSYKTRQSIQQDNPRDQRDLKQFARTLADTLKTEYNTTHHSDSRTDKLQDRESRRSCRRQEVVVVKGSTHNVMTWRINPDPKQSENTFFKGDNEIILHSINKDVNSPIFNILRTGVHNSPNSSGALSHKSIPFHPPYYVTPQKNSLKYTNNTSCTKDKLSSSPNRNEIPAKTINNRSFLNFGQGDKRSLESVSQMRHAIKLQNIELDKCRFQFKSEAEDKINRKKNQFISSSSGNLAVFGAIKRTCYGTTGHATPNQSKSKTFFNGSSPTASPTLTASRRLNLAPMTASSNQDSKFMRSGSNTQNVIFSVPCSPVKEAKQSDVILQPKEEKNLTETNNIFLQKSSSIPSALLDIPSTKTPGSSHLRVSNNHNGKSSSNTGVFFNDENTPLRALDSKSSSNGFRKTAPGHLDRQAFYKQKYGGFIKSISMAPE